MSNYTQLLYVDAISTPRTNADAVFIPNLCY